MERKLAIIAEGQDRSGSKMLKGLNGDLGGLDKSAKGLASGGLKELTSSLGGSLGGLGSLAAGALATGGGLAALGMAVNATVDYLKWATDQAEEAAKVQAQLDAVLRSTGNAAGMASEELDTLANSLEATSGIEDDVIKRNEALMLTFKKIGEEVFPGAMQAALDMSAAMGQDLQGSIMQVGKALNDPIEGLGALRRVGVTFTQQQEAQIAAMVESGDVMGAQQMILAELASEFGGAAEAINEASDGSAALNNALGDLGETIGGELLPTQRVWNGLLAATVDGLNELIIGLLEGKTASQVIAEGNEEAIASYLAQKQAIEDAKHGQQLFSEESYSTALQMDGLTVAGTGVAGMLLDLSANWKDNTDLLVENELEQQRIKAAMQELATAMQGPVGKELDKFIEKQGELQGEAARVAAEIARLKGLGYDDQSTKVQELKGEYVELQGQIGAVADEHSKAMKQIVYDLTLAEMSVGGLTTSEQMALDALAQDLGLVDEATVNARGAIEDLIAASDPTRPDLLAKAIAAYTEAVAAGKGETIAMMNAMDALDGKEVTATVNINVNGYVPDLGVVGADQYQEGQDYSDEDFVMKAAGGPVKPGGSYPVGEMGVELFKPNRAGQVVPNDQVGAAGGNIFNLYFPDAIIRNDQEVELLARRVAAQLVEVLR